MARGRATRRMRRLQRGARFLFGLLLTGVIVVGLFHLLESDYFLVREVEIAGLERVSAAEVQRDAGLGNSFFIWEMRPRRVEALLLRHPRISAADVGLGWPNRVRVKVVEHRPVGLVMQRGPLYVEVDGKGHVMQVWRDLPAPGLPLVTGVELGDVRPGDTIQDRRVLRALAVAGTLGSVGRDRVSEIHADPSGEGIVYTTEGVPVFLGFDDWESKARMFLGMADSLVFSSIAYIDLRTARRPVVRMKKDPIIPISEPEEEGIEGEPPNVPLN